MGARMVHLEWVNDRARFDALAEAWDALALAQPTPFAAHAWLAAWWDAFAEPPAELRVGAPLERWRRKMDREHELVARIVEPPQDLASELVRGFAVEASGWKGRAGTAIVSSPETERFYRAVAERFVASDRLRLSWLDLD